MRVKFSRRFRPAVAGPNSYCGCCVAEIHGLCLARHSAMKAFPSEAKKPVLSEKATEKVFSHVGVPAATACRH